jgi:hypothetical protein
MEQEKAKKIIYFVESDFTERCVCLIPFYLQFTAFMFGCTNNIFVHLVPHSTTFISNIKKIPSKLNKPHIILNMT